MGFSILGPLEVSLDSQGINLGGIRQQTAMAVLLLDAGRTVSVGRFMEAIYGDEPPTTARAQIQICISALRRQFAAHGRSNLITTQAQAYAVHVRDEELDARRFDQLIQRAKALSRENRAEDAITAYRQALGIWRGPALEGIESRLVQSAAGLLDESRIAANEDCLELELILGRHHGLVGELTALVEEHPLRERLREHLMLALYRSGRQAEALQVYRRTRQTMIDELGIEPNERLQQLEHAILTSSPSLELPEASATPVILSHRIVPRLLPTDIADFTGRTKQIDEILERLAPVSGESAGYAVPIVAVVGKPGIGKSTIAVHVAHRVAAQYPDGQLFANLHGAASRPVGPAQVLERFLRALGITGSAVPDRLEERAEMYRDLLADRKMLIVLDDVGTESQVMPLLPGHPSSAMILSSRSRLAGLPGAYHVDVDVFDSAQSLDLLARIAGAERVQTEPGATAALARLCGQLPLALRIAGARLAARPHWSVGQLVERLEDETRRLDELKHGEMGIRASISLTYESVSEDARRLFRRLAILDAPTFSAWLSAALLDRSIREAQDLLEDLADAQLVEITGTGRGLHTQYCFHDLIRVFARERLAAEEPPAERRAGLARVLEGLLSLVEAARRREHEDHIMIPVSPASWELPEELVARLVERPHAWFERERSNIVSGIRQAAQAGFVETCWGLALGAASFFLSRIYFDDWREIQQVALTAVLQASDERGHAVMLYTSGSLASAEQRFDDARRDLGAAIELFTKLGDERGLGSAVANMGHLDMVTGRIDTAAGHFERALELARRSGSPSMAVRVLQNLAQVRLARDDAEEARRLLSEATSLARSGVGRRMLAQVLHRLGQTHLQQGEPLLAVEVLSEALESIQAVGDSIGEAYILLGLGLARVRLGEYAEASSTLRHALLLANTHTERLAKGKALAGLAELALAEGRPEEAVGWCKEAIGLFRAITMHVDEAEALSTLSEAQAALGREEEAYESLSSALDVVGRIDLVASRGMSARYARRLRAMRPDQP